MSGQLTFNKTRNGSGTRMYGKLVWGTDEYDAVSGGYGKGALIDGAYSIRKKHAVEGDEKTMSAGYLNPMTKEGWFLPIEPKFVTKRKGFGIHPDGNKPGTLGCIGLQGVDIDRFWKKWNKTPMDKRPSSVTVQTIMIRHSADSGT